MIATFVFGIIIVFFVIGYIYMTNTVTGNIIWGIATNAEQNLTDIKVTYSEGARNRDFPLNKGKLFSWLLTLEYQEQKSNPSQGKLGGSAYIIASDDFYFVYVDYEKMITLHIDGKTRYFYIGDNSKKTDDFWKDIVYGEEW